MRRDPDLCCICDHCEKPIDDDTDLENNGLCDACLNTELELELETDGIRAA